MRKMKDSGIEWIGEIPEDWEVRRIKTLFQLRNEKSFKPLNEVNLISLYTDKGVLQHSEIEYVAGNKASNADGYKCVYEEDIVVNIILCWMGAIGRSSYNGVTSPAYDIYKPNVCTNSSFYHYYFRTNGFNGECFQRGRGIMLMRWRTYSEDFMDIKVCYPPLVEQQKIADFLDKKCSEIDSVISKTRETIEEYKKLKQSIITEVVTGKVKIENGKVCGKYDTYKDSGIEWIGEIPSEWEVKRLKFSSKVRNEKYSESYGVLEYFGLENIESHSAKFIETENIYDITQSQICRKDDIVFGKLRPYLAKIFEVPIDECCSSEFAVFYNFEGYNKFFKYLFLSYWFITIVDASTYGTKMPRANIDFIKNMIIPLPDFENQYKIADFLDKKCSEIDKLITKKEQLVVELESYKKSLIYEVVTGKRSV